MWYWYHNYSPNSLIEYWLARNFPYRDTDFSIMDQALVCGDGTKKQQIVPISDTWTRCKVVWFVIDQNNAESTRLSTKATRISFSSALFIKGGQPMSTEPNMLQCVYHFRHTFEFHNGNQSSGATVVRISKCCQHMFGALNHITKAYPYVQQAVVIKVIKFE